MVSLQGDDLEGGQYEQLSVEESALKTLKKQLKETFAKIGQDKETFDASQENMVKFRIVQSAEKLIASAEEAMSKYKFQLQMLRGTSADNRSKFAKDLNTMEIGL